MTVYDCPMDANTNPTAEISAIGTYIDGGIKLYHDPYLALAEFVSAPIADRFGLTGEEIEETFDTEQILFAVTEYDSISGREGRRFRADMTDERYWAIVEGHRI